KREWERLVKAYADPYNVMINGWFHKRIGAVEGEKEGDEFLPTTVSGLYELFKQEEYGEYASVQRVEQSRILSGLSKEELVLLGKSIPSRKSVKETLKLLNERNIKRKILSTNWSKEMLCGCLEDIVDENEIVANSLCFDSEESA